MTWFRTSLCQRGVHGNCDAARHGLADAHWCHQVCPCRCTCKCHDEARQEAA